MDKPHLVVDNTGGPQGVVVSDGSSSSSERIYAHDGGTWIKIPPGGRPPGGQSASSPGDGGGPMRLTLPDLRWNVAILNGLASLFFFGLIGMWLWMVDRIDDKFDAADIKIVAVSDKVSDLRVDIANQSGDIKTILEKVNDQPEESTDGE